jgi:dihydrofolate reductase
MSLALIVAVSENNVIGVRGDLPWQLSADLRRFQKLTMGHHIVMGRKTFESIGRLLPGRTTVIVTRQTVFQFDGALVVASVEEGLEAVKIDPLPFVIGGGEIFSLFLPLVSEIHLTRVHATVEGDTFLPKIDWNQWAATHQEWHSADSKNNFDHTYLVYHRRNGILSANRSD